MLNTCTNCGEYNVEKEIIGDGKYAKCPACGHRQEINRMPLFCITGASGIGKSTICRELFLREKEYIVLESDILWNDLYNTPEDNYREYNELKLRLCKNISQIGKPVVLCGCSTPQGIEVCKERRYFSTVYYLAVVGSDELLRKRLTKGRNVEDNDWVNSSIDFNRWLKENGDKTEPRITLLDITDISKDEAAVLIDSWITERM
ncbi:MAG: hypothetical protein ACOC2J_03035 [bacterium]